MKRILVFILLFISYHSFASDTVKIYVFDIDKEISRSMWRIVDKATKEAVRLKSDYILIRMNTYGGLLDAADSIRTRLMTCPIPVMVFVNHNAASAGALISIAADSIFMSRGSNIGAATVVDQQGQVVPDKYQSYMRSLMRSTAESHGKKKVVHGKDTVEKWVRDPRIAEAMVDPRIKIKDINDSGKVLTFTTSEAIENGYCEGERESIDDIIIKTGFEKYTITEYKVSGADSLVGFFMNPIVQGILIMIIVAGIYFEFQAPGFGFPIMAAIIAAVLYFAPLYIEGIANHWIIIAFILGIILLALEIFVIPGFGVSGIAGIILILLSLTMAMIQFKTTTPFGGSGINIVVKSLLVVVGAIVVSLSLSIYIASKFLESRSFGLALTAQQNANEGYVGVDVNELNNLIGKTGTADTVLRPSGMVKIEGMVYDAKSEYGFIDKGTPVKVVRTEAGQIYVVKL
jgi:membrane-bound serine protease (ClpP class)